MKEKLDKIIRETLELCFKKGLFKEVPLPDLDQLGWVSGLVR